eukprot:903617-Prorocentrum_minimum.AAC.1
MEDGPAVERVKVHPIRLLARAFRPPPADCARMTDSAGMTNCAGSNRMRGSPRTDASVLAYLLVTANVRARCHSRAPVASQFARGWVEQSNS